MSSPNQTASSQDFLLKSALGFLHKTIESRDELNRERESAVRAGELDWALQHTQDLCRCHGDYLQVGLELVSFRRSQSRNRIQNQGPESAAHQFPTNLLGPQASEAAFKNSREESEEAEARDERQGVSVGAERDPLMAKDLTPESVWKAYRARMEEEKLFLERLKQVAQRDKNPGLVRKCRNELRDLHRDRYERQKEIGSFEEENQPPVDPRATEARMWQNRLRVISQIRELAKERGVLSTDGRWIWP